jgi:hypothetical protein
MRYPMHGDSGHAVVLGADGVSMTSPGSAATVHFAQCAVMLAFPDGGRLLIGDDGVTCRVEPTLYPVDAEALARLDAAVPAATTVRMPARDPEMIPQPPTRATRGRARAERSTSGAQRFRGLTIAAAVGLGVLTVFCALSSAVATQSVITDPDPEFDGLSRALVLSLFWGATASIVVLCALAVRRLRR